MLPGRPHMSITLPRNFTFHYTDGQAPKTPEPEQQIDDPQPPAPPRQTYRIRRRRAAIPIYDEPSNFHQTSRDDPIPTIEAPELSSDDSFGFPEALPEPIEGFLAPAPSISRLISPPRTPEAQMGTNTGDRCGRTPLWAELGHYRQEESISRPTSSCSGISDSSASSRGSLDSFPSFGGSCTSPEEDMTDPFLYHSQDMKYNRDDSPLDNCQQRPAKKFKLRAETVWTEDMDNHLWMAYMRYLQDPTVTPFKMLPGTAPPLGVCHRVVREAKKTWKGPRMSSSVSSSRLSSHRPSRSGSPDTIKPNKSGSSTPTAGMGKPYPKWPRSESATRRRLRQLCKRKPSLSAHYQRLLHCRSPSPFQSSPRSGAEDVGPRLSSPFSEQASSFSTRDMNISLATSTASSMQYGNPLSQLTSDATPRARNEEWGSHQSSRSSAHQKSQSLHIGLGIGNMLGSSFVTMSQMTGMSSNQPSSQTWHPSAHAPRLDPPLELHSPIPLPRSFKRRALHNLEDGSRPRGSGVRQNLLEELFGAPAESSHRRVRSRGFSLGDMGEGARRLSSMFTPPSAVESMGSPDMSIGSNASDMHTSPQLAQGQSTIRLGSPFGGRSSNVHFNNTFPRAFSHAFEAPASFEQRFGEMSSDSKSKDPFNAQL